MAKYKRTQNLVDAVQWTGGNFHEIALFTRKFSSRSYTEAYTLSYGTIQDVEAGMTKLYHSFFGSIEAGSWIVVEKTDRISTTVYPDEIFQNLFEFCLDSDE